MKTMSNPANNSLSVSLECGGLTPLLEARGLTRAVVNNPVRNARRLVPSSWAEFKPASSRRTPRSDRLKAYRENLQELKGNGQVCVTTVGMGQNILLAERSAMDHILDAIREIRAYRAELAKKA